MNKQPAIPSLLNLMAQKIRIVDQRPMYVCVHDDRSRAEVFLRESY